MTDRKRVLILCTGNSCRSQMAEGWVRHDLGRIVDVYSAGTHPSFVHPLAVEAMREAGVDISRHRSKSLLEYLDEPFDLIVTVCDSASQTCPVFPGAKRQIHEPIPDPVDCSFLGESALTRFREVRDLIRARIVHLVEREA